MDDSVVIAMREKLDESNIKSNLLLASVFILSYEILRSSIVDQTIDNYSAVLDDSEVIAFRKVLKNLSEHSVEAACLWLKEQGAISDQDVKTISDIRKHRNLIAHELPNLILDYRVHVDLDLLNQAFILQKKVDLWWFSELSFLHHSDPESVDLDSVQTGNMVVMNLILNALVREDQRETEDHH